MAVPDADYEGQGDLIKYGEVCYTSEPPQRTDDQKVAVIDFELKREVPLERWDKLTTREMRAKLEESQTEIPGSPLVVCAGCGRALERPFMELDHNLPKSMFGEKTITNRILICRPCNDFKSNTEQFKGLWKSNVGRNWMLDGDKAKGAYTAAIKRGREVKNELRY